MRASERIGHLRSARDLMDRRFAEPPAFDPATMTSSG